MISQGAETYYVMWQHFCRKLHESERNGAGRSRSPRIRHCFLALVERLESY